MADKNNVKNNFVLFHKNSVIVNTVHYPICCQNQFKHLSTYQSYRHHIVQLQWGAPYFVISEVHLIYVESENFVNYKDYLNPGCVVCSPYFVPFPD